MSDQSLPAPSAPNGPAARSLRNPRPPVAPTGGQRGNLPWVMHHMQRLPRWRSLPFATETLLLTVFDSLCFAFWCFVAIALIVQCVLLVWVYCRRAPAVPVLAHPPLYSVPVTPPLSRAPFLWNVMESDAKVDLPYLTVGPIRERLEPLRILAYTASTSDKTHAASVKSAAPQSDTRKGDTPEYPSRTLDVVGPLSQALIYAGRQLDEWSARWAGIASPHRRGLPSSAPMQPKDADVPFITMEPLSIWKKSFCVHVLFESRRGKLSVALMYQDRTALSSSTAFETRLAVYRADGILEALAQLVNRSRRCNGGEGCEKTRGLPADVLSSDAFSGDTPSTKSLGIAESDVDTASAVAIFLRAVYNRLHAATLWGFSKGPLLKEEENTNAGFSTPTDGSSMASFNTEDPPASLFNISVSLPRGTRSQQSTLIGSYAPTQRAKWRQVVSIALPTRAIHQHALFTASLGRSQSLAVAFLTQKGEETEWKLNLLVDTTADCLFLRSQNNSSASYAVFHYRLQPGSALSALAFSRFGVFYARIGDPELFRFSAPLTELCAPHARAPPKGDLENVPILPRGACDTQTFLSGEPWSYTRDLRVIERSEETFSEIGFSTHTALPPLLLVSAFQSGIAQSSALNAAGHPKAAEWMLHLFDLAQRPSAAHTASTRDQPMASSNQQPPVCPSKPKPSIFPTVQHSSLSPTFCRCSPATVTRDTYRPLSLAIRFNPNIKGTQKDTVEVLQNHLMQQLAGLNTEAAVIAAGLTERLPRIEVTGAPKWDEGEYPAVSTYVQLRLSSPHQSLSLPPAFGNSQPSLSLRGVAAVLALHCTNTAGLFSSQPTQARADPALRVPPVQCYHSPLHPLGKHFVHQPGPSTTHATNLSLFPQREQRNSEEATTLSHSLRLLHLESPFLDHFRAPSLQSIKTVVNAEQPANRPFASGVASQTAGLTAVSDDKTSHVVQLLGTVTPQSVLTFGHLNISALGVPEDLSPQLSRLQVLLLQSGELLILQALNTPSSNHSESPGLARRSRPSWCRPQRRLFNRTSHFLCWLGDQLYTYILLMRRRLVIVQLLSCLIVLAIDRGVLLGYIFRGASTATRSTVTVPTRPSATVHQTSSPLL